MEEEKVIATIPTSRILSVAPLYESIGCDSKAVLGAFWKQINDAKARNAATLTVKGVEFPVEQLLVTTMLLDVAATLGSIARFTDAIVRHGLTHAQLVHLPGGDRKVIKVTRDGSAWKRLTPQQEARAS